jgi:uncharacterized phiE125 gp8 family phage protein
MLSPLRLEVDPLAGSPLPVDLDLIKAHAAIDSTDFDALLPVYLFAAIDWAENAMHRTIFARPHRWVLRDFPHTRFEEIGLPRGKTQAVEKIEYVSGNQTVTLTGPSSGSPAGTDYREDLRGDDGGVVAPGNGRSWPSVDYDAPAPVIIHFTAGWTVGSVPSAIIHALLFAVADAFEMRSEADLSGSGTHFQAREALISPYRLVRLYA